MNPNHVVTWLPGRPNLVIQCLHGRGTSTNRGYHESYYEIVSSRALTSDDFRRLDECGLLGVGQCYDVLKHDAFEEETPPVVIERGTGKKLDVVPTNYKGEPYTVTNSYVYHRYEIRRICDSGD